MVDELASLKMAVELASLKMAVELASLNMVELASLNSIVNRPACLNMHG